ncbi:MAG: Crp/Fnr family transcriptional regulator [Pseudomonadota bacterium]
MTKMLNEPMPVKTECSACPLRLMSRFREFEDAELEFISEFKAGELAVQPGTGILEEGSNSPHLFTVLSGWAFRYKSLSDGSRQILNFALPGDFLGLQASVFDMMDHSVEALTDVTLCVFPRDKVWTLFRQHPSLAHDLTWLATAEERVLGAHLTAVGQRSAPARIAFLLLHLYERCEPMNLAGGDKLLVPFTQAHLADVLGLSLVHTNKSIRKLTSNELLRWDKGLVTFLDRPKLMDMAEMSDATPAKRPFI